jgi:hypothetical protein
MTDRAAWLHIKVYGERAVMTDPKLVEQAEREIAAELGLEIILGSKSSAIAGQKVRISSAALEDSLWVYGGLGKLLWEALVRDRCSLLALRSALTNILQSVQA